MKIDENSTLEQVAAAVAAALDRAGIRAVLTGGAAAVIYTGGEYPSEDLDFILQSSPTQERLDKVLSEIGFSRKRDHYVHRLSPFFIEFPRGPLSIGRDIRIGPVKTRVGREKILALSATDSCRDRLAAFRKKIQLPPELEGQMASSADALDAVLCAFAGIAVTQGKLASAPAASAIVEGWIAVHW